MILFEHVSKTFKQADKEIVVLRDANFEVKDKGIYAIVGQSGSGKSTMLSLLAGLDKPTAGKVSIAGTDISDLDESELTSLRAKNIGIVFQSFNLISHFTALENVLLPLEVLGFSDAKEKALKLLDDVGLSHRVNHFPEELSGGEKQRVAIARASASQARIILADEPSGNLDPETGDKIMKTLFETARKLEQILILVTHDRDLASKCDAIFEIKNQSITKL